MVRLEDHEAGHTPRIFPPMWCVLKVSRQGTKANAAGPTFGAVFPAQTCIATLAGKTQRTPSHRVLDKRSLLFVLLRVLGVVLLNWFWCCLKWNTLTTARISFLKCNIVFKSINIKIYPSKIFKTIQTTTYKQS